MTSHWYFNLWFLDSWWGLALFSSWKPMYLFYNFLTWTWAIFCWNILFLWLICMRPGKIKEPLFVIPLANNFHRLSFNVVLWCLGGWRDQGLNALHKLRGFLWSNALLNSSFQPIIPRIFRPSPPQDYINTYLYILVF